VFLMAQPNNPTRSRQPSTKWKPWLLFTARPAGLLRLISRAARSEGAAGGRRCLSLRVRRPATPERRTTCPRMSPRRPAGRPVNSNSVPTPWVRSCQPGHQADSLRCYHQRAGS
jgi:hypothetical protein